MTSTNSLNNFFFDAYHKELLLFFKAIYSISKHKEKSDRQSPDKILFSLDIVYHFPLDAGRILVL